MVGAGGVGASHGRATDVVLALIDVQTALGREDESLLAATLSIAALLAILTVCVDPAAWITELVDTDLTTETILVRVAQLEAHTLGALLPSGALPMALALLHTVAIETFDSLPLAGLVIATSLWNTDASLKSSGNSGKPNRTLANQFRFGSLLFAD